MLVGVIGCKFRRGHIEQIPKPEIARVFGTNGDSETTGESQRSQMQRPTAACNQLGRVAVPFDSTVLVNLCDVGIVVVNLQSASTRFVVFDGTEETGVNRSARQVLSWRVRSREH